MQQEEMIHSKQKFTSLYITVRLFREVFAQRGNCSLRSGQRGLISPDPPPAVAQSVESFQTPWRDEGQTSILFIVPVSIYDSNSFPSPPSLSLSISPLRAVSPPHTHTHREHPTPGNIRALFLVSLCFPQHSPPRACPLAGLGD